ncbi:MAG: AAA family ATPase [Novosphingobium sp.]|nr:AAA family ATPase [Novosphingobium sp.]
MSEITKLFTEKFRPKNLGQLIAPARVKEELNKGLIQNLLLHGSPGTGKTSTLFILAQNHPTLYINASEEGGIDTIREKIGKFCATISLEGGKEDLKCVILDELDGASENFYKALRAVMERYSGTARFIASCNYIQKIPEPISESRFHKISFDPIDKEEENFLLAEYEKRIAAILNAAKIEFTPEILAKFIRNDFPDLRALMNKVQSFHLRGVKKLDEKNFNINFDYKDLFDLCLNSNGKAYDNYKFIINQYGNKIDDTLVALGQDFPEYLKSVSPQNLDKLPMVLIALADYQYQKSFAIDPLVTLLAAIFKIQQILK